MTTDTHRYWADPRNACFALGAWLLPLLLVMISWPANAASEVLVVIAERSAPHSEVLAAMRAGLGEALGRKLNLRTVSAAEFAGSAGQAGDRRLADLVVTIGTQAARVVLPQRLPVPVYCTFLPEATYATLLAESGSGTAANGRHSALFVDQPITRQLRLLHLALPQRTRVGVVLGPESHRSEPELRRAARAAGLTLHVERIAEEKQLIQALYRVMDDTDVLLAVPDPLVFNRETAESVLLTTYRLGKPVMAYSRAYVIAGALLSVYSTPAQIGQEIAEELPALLDAPGRGLPPPHYPRHYSVEVNQRVARSLGLDVDSAGNLMHELADSPGEKQP